MSCRERIPFVDLVTRHVELEEELTGIFQQALRTAGFIGGSMVEEFEQEFAAFCNTACCVAVNSGTDALRFALVASGVQPGDVVLTVPNTFIATTEAISQSGALPEFVEVDQHTYNMDAEKLRQHLETQCAIDATGKLISRRNGRLDAIQAGILRVKLNRLASWNTQRRERAREYNRLLASATGSMIVPYEPSWSRAVYHLYVVRTENQAGMVAHLHTAGIGAGIHYPIPLHLQKAHSALRYIRGDFPVCERITAQIVSLPMFPQLTNEQQARIAEEILQFIESEPVAHPPSREPVQSAVIGSP